MTVPSQDLLIGSYYLTELRGRDSDETGDADADAPVFRHLHQIEQALDLGGVRLHQLIEWRIPQLSDGNGGYVPTTPGRALFNAALPDSFEYVNRPVRKGDMGRIVRALSDNYSTTDIAVSLDNIKDLCYAYASRSGLTISVDDVRTPPDKAEILERHESEAERVETQFRRGIITDGERRQKEVEIWTDATDEVRRSLEAELSRTTFNPIDMMVGSGARGEHDAGAPDRGDPRAGGQPSRRHHPAPHQVVLPRGPRHAGVLHLHAGRPQGPGGHGAADGRLGLPDPPPRGCGPGAHHQQREPLRAPRPGERAVDRGRRP